MCCDPKGSLRNPVGLECSCCGPGGLFRRFVTSEEAEKCLEEYKDQLKREIAGVEERIRGLKGE